MELHVTEQKWDKTKSNKTLRSSVAYSINSEKLAKIARSNGVDEVLRWKAPSVRKKTKKKEDYTNSVVSDTGVYLKDRLLTKTNSQHQAQK